MASCVEQQDEAVSFNHYEKMPSDTNGWVSKRLDAIKDWVALEKVHGANLSFTAQRTDQAAVCVKVARRNAYLNEGENFFAIYQQKGFVEGEIEKVKRLFDEVCAAVEGPVLAVTVYGELFGGYYPHPDVQAPLTKPIQKEVIYCPDLRFMAFDIAVIYDTPSTQPDTASTQPDITSTQPDTPSTQPDTPSTQSDGEEQEQERVYLDYDVCMRVFKSCGLLYAEPLLTGTLQAMLDFPLGWDSNIPAALGLPPLPGHIKNPAEGVVVKPLKNIVIETTRGNEPMRVIFKRKIDGFRETRPRVKVSQPKKATAEYNQDYELVKCEMLLMVTPQRLMNVISKLGVPDMAVESQREVKAKWNTILNGLAADVLEEMALVHEDLWKAFKREHAQMVGRIKSDLKRECAVTVKEYREKNA